MRKTQEEIDQIRELIAELDEEGMSTEEIGFCLGITPATVRRYRKIQRIPRLQKKKTKEELCRQWGKIHSWYVRFRSRPPERETKVLIAWEDYSRGTAWLREGKE